MLALADPEEGGLGLEPPFFGSWKITYISVEN
jgi:hypothetical protein